MALKLREGSANKAELPVDPQFEIPTADAAEQLLAQNQLDQALMSRTVVVTLEKPYLGDPKATVVLAWGREPATPSGNFGKMPDVVPNRSLLPDQDPGFVQPQWIPGRWRHYHLRFEEGPLGSCKCEQNPDTIVGQTCYMPSPVAKAYFGDWNVIEYALRAQEGRTQEPEQTLTWHRDRVANEMWGGYGYDFPAGVPGVKRGELRKFDPPAVPHVVIQRIDTMNRRIPNSEVRPWDIFRWQDQLHTGPRAYHGGNGPKAQGVVAVTEGELSAMVEQLVNARLAQMTIQQQSNRKGAQ